MTRLATPATCTVLALVAAAAPIAHASPTKAACDAYAADTVHLIQDAQRLHCPNPHGLWTLDTQRSYVAACLASVGAAIPANLAERRTALAQCKVIRTRDPGPITPDRTKGATTQPAPSSK